MRRSARFSPGSSAGTWCWNTPWARPPSRWAGRAIWSACLASLGLASAAAIHRDRSARELPTAGGHRAVQRSRRGDRRSSSPALLMLGTRNRRGSTTSWSPSSCSWSLIVIVVGGLLCRRANWTPFIPPQHRRVRPFRLQRHPARRRGGVLRLYRLRRRFDRRAGGAYAAARHADRHARLADHLHRALYRRWPRC